MLSKLSFSPNNDMFLTFLGFWNSTISTFVFLCGIMSPTLFDVATMLGLPIIGEDIPTLHYEDFEDLGCLVYKEITSYSKYMEKHRRLQGAVNKTEHNAFIFFWLCKFFICSNSLATVNEYSYYMVAIISSRLINLGALFLSLFYKGLKLWINQLKAKENKATPCPMWFLFLWVNEYFPEVY